MNFESFLSTCLFACRREQWALTGAFACWQAALENTKALSRDHAALAELYAGPLAARLQRAADDALRLHRKCRDIGNVPIIDIFKIDALNYFGTRELANYTKGACKRATRSGHWYSLGDFLYNLYALAAHL